MQYTKTVKTSTNRSVKKVEHRAVGASARLGVKSLLSYGGIHLHQ